MKDPEPVAAFQGFGEYYLEFKLYFWLTENLIVGPSDVSIGIYKALKEAGITMPVQKTEFYCYLLFNISIELIERIKFPIDT